MAENAVAKQPVTNPIKAFFMQESVQRSIREIMKENTPQFVTTVLQIANGNSALQKANPVTLMSAALTAAALDLPINPNLGFAYIVPYKGQAAFQMGWKGYVQLAQRTGLYKTINVIEVYENEIESEDRISGEIILKSNVTPGGKVAGYLAYFRLLTGFEKMFFMRRDKVHDHAKKYSQSFKKNEGVWADGEDGFNSMAKKTVLKLLLGRFGPLSVQMQRAIRVDQAVIGENPEDITYVDNTINEKADIDKESERFELVFKDADTRAKLIELKNSIAPEKVDLIDRVNGKLDQLTIEGKE